LKKHTLLLAVLVSLFACAWHGGQTGGLHPPSPGVAAKESVSHGSVKGLQLVKVIGETKLGASLLSSPTGIAVDLLGNLFIVDSGNDRLVKCDSEGRFMAETGGFGWEAGQFNRPTYVAADNGLNAYVADTQNKRIQRFDQSLNFVSSIQIKARSDFSGFGLIEGIAINSSGEIIVSDVEEDLLVKLSSSYEYEKTFGGLAEVPGGLRDPLGAFINQDGSTYVADSENDRVVVFDVFGNFVKSMGERILSHPSGVAVALDQTVYVADTGDNSIAVLDPDGNLILRYGGDASGLVSLSKPTDLKLGKENKLFVVDSGNNRICVFETLR
jgi:tripartite motif-containing protein 71